ncbi:MAG: type-F conjugative transfer system protein TraW [Sphingobacteriia bacterium]|nr:type-F conjugative transfer system protein TraW [Sphingobacteriia bacterium]
MKTINFLLILYLVVFSFNISLAKDFGTWGEVKPIKEINLIEYIKLKIEEKIKKEGLLKHQKQLSTIVENKINNPQAVSGIKDAENNRVYYYDPSIVVNEDIYDHHNNIIARKGDKHNPLDNVNLSKELIFINGTNIKQIEYVKQQIKNQKNFKIILVKGNPKKLSEKLEKGVFFDQFGALTNKLGIKAVPCKVSQENKMLKIEEFNVEDIQYN